MNAISSASLSPLPQFSKTAKGPQTLQVDHREPRTRNSTLGFIPEDFHTSQYSEASGENIYRSGDGYHRNPQGRSQSVVYPQPLKGPSGRLMTQKASSEFTYDPKDGIKQRRALGGVAGAVAGGLAGLAVSLVTGSEVTSSVATGASVGGASGLLSKWNSKAPVPTLEWREADAKTAELVGYDHRVSEDPKGESYQNSYQPILLEKSAGRYFEPVLLP